MCVPSTYETGAGKGGKEGERGEQKEAPAETDLQQLNYCESLDCQLSVDGPQCPQRLSEGIPR